ncbi:MAG: hypothetical protein M3R60_09930 [Pseudomonadota bacterium]|nr:hypothetical protein [Pseudomonadota bacterium]
MSAILTQDLSMEARPAAEFSANLPTVTPNQHATIHSAEHRLMVRSKLNVRRKSSSVTELAALIRSQGLLQNLVGFFQLTNGDPTTVDTIGGRNTPNQSAFSKRECCNDVGGDVKLTQAADLDCPTRSQATQHAAMVFGFLLVQSKSAAWVNFASAPTLSSR